MDNNGFDDDFDILRGDGGFNLFADSDGCDLGLLLLGVLYDELAYYLENGRDFKHIDILLDLCTHVIGNDCLYTEQNRGCLFNDKYHPFSGGYSIRDSSRNLDHYSRRDVSFRYSLKYFIDNFVCRLLTKSDTCVFSDSVIKLFRGTYFISSFYMKKVFDYFINIFKESTTPMKKLILEITIMVFVEGYKNLEEYYDHFCYFINISFEEGGCLLIGLTRQFLIDPLRCQINLNIHKILPKIFNNLFTLVKRCWNIGERARVAQLISCFMAMDRLLFEKCLFEQGGLGCDQQLQVKIFEAMENGPFKESPVNQRRRSLYGDGCGQSGRMRRDGRSPF